MKKILTLSMFILITGITYSQTDHKDSTQHSSRHDRASKQSSFHAIYNIPLGDFGSTTAENAGYADHGWGIGFEKKTYAYRGIYFTSSSSYSWIPLNTAQLSADLEEATGLYSEIDGGQHRPFFSTVGLGLDLKPVQLFSVSINSQIGLLYNSFKPMNVQIYQNGPNSNLLVNDVMKFDSDFAFGYSFGVDFQLFLVPNLISAFVSGKYSAGKIDSYLRSHHTEPIKAVSKLEMFQLNFGLSFHAN